MEPAFDEARVLRRLESLPTRAVLAFALSCSERLFPNYLAFVRAHAWGDPDVLRQALDAGWQALQERGPDVRTRRRLLSLCQGATPDMEDFSSVYASPGLDAAVTACLVLQFLDEEDVSLVAQIASLCCDTVDMYVQELEDMSPNDPRLEERILSHPLMQEELARQRLDLTLLQRHPLSEEGVADFMSRWRSPRRSNIGLGG